MGDAGDSDGAGGSSLAGGGPAALGVGDKGLGRWRGAKAPHHPCHHGESIVKVAWQHLISNKAPQSQLAT